MPNILINKILGYDHRIFELIVQREKYFLRRFLSIFTHLGDGVFWIICCIFFFLFGQERLRHFILVIILAQFFGLIMIIILRYLTKRERPYPIKYVLPWNRYSFPSAHTTRVFIIATIIGKEYPFWLLFLLIWALTIGFSRIYLKKHYPLDVFFAMIIGIFCGVISLNLNSFI